VGRAVTESAVEVIRGRTLESRHRVHIAIAQADPGLVAWCGDAACVSYVRSAIKMFQVLPLVEDGGLAQFGLTDQELAVCTASHNGESFHVAAARSILRKAGVAEDALACGPHPPMHDGAADALTVAGDRPGRIHNNCSGKHAGMLALAQLKQWPIDGYHLLEHPLQQRVLATLVRWTGVAADRMEIAVDGCGLPTFALPLDSMALACARMAAAAGDRDTASARVIAAMTAHPEYVAGTDRLCTDLMRATNGRVFAKVGAEGYYCAGVPGRQLGIALKVEDGAKRASEPALLAALGLLDVLSHAELDGLAKYFRPVVVNTRGEHVGEIRASLDLQQRKYG
jgi:L-asparaginase II